jgi:predicted solute-binding protein
MLHGDQRGLFDLSFAVPSECADRLRAGGADLGIVPSIEMARQQLDHLPGLCIASRGAVRSLLLVSKLPWERVRTLAADTSSRTTVALARILLARRYGVTPEFLPRPPGLEPMLAEADAALLIGDPALRIEPAALPWRVLDVGEEWLALTGLPAVYAVWAGKHEFITPEIAALFAGSCRFGLAHLDEIVRREAPGRGLPLPLAREYFERNVVYELGAEQYRGLDLFLRYAAESDMLVPAGARKA